MGLPCVTLAPEDLAALMDAVTLDPEQSVEIDLDAREVRHRGRTYAANVPDGSRKQLIEGTWNATAVLLGAGNAIEATAERLPYTSGFRS
jgi:3-isopropylmalate/(R)-2-methylmalate dehydratase small subunit